MATADDEAHLIYAREHQLCLVTKDAGFRARHFRWLEDGKSHYGIFYCKDRNIASIGKIVTTCYEFFQLIEAGAGTIDDIWNEFFEIV